VNRRKAALGAILALCGLAYVGTVQAVASRVTPRPVVVLIGTGCGPDRLTLAAWEESDFPHNCEAIETAAVLGLTPANPHRINAYRNQ
jgi:hypothetical protein